MLKGKTAVITGGVRGIGKCIAETFCKNGANVIIVDISSPEAFEATEAELKEYGTTVKSLNGDITNPETAKKVAQLIKDEFDKKVDILVNNAGITRDGLLMKMSEEDFDQVLDTNLKGAFHTIRFASSQMLRQKSGRIINMASVVGVSGNAGQANYAASKAGVIGLTKATAKELASRGITVNAIAPGFIETEMTAVLSDKVKEATAAQIPLGTFGQPEDVANAVAFLASDEARYITGQVLHVDGGLVC